MKQHIIGYFRKHYKENISLLLILAMVLSFVPGVYAQEKESEMVEETILETVSETAPETTSETIPETVPETTSETTSETNQESTPESDIGETSETVTDDAPDSIGEETFAHQLLLLPTLKEVFDAMMADKEAVYALTVEEIAELKVYTQSLYDEIAEPTQDDTEYLELILDTLTMLEEELTIPVELLDETVTIVRNGSRLLLNGAESCQWQRLDDSGEYANIDGAVGTCYDLTTADSNASIRAQVGENTFTNPIQIPGDVVMFDISKGKVTLGGSYSVVDADGKTISKSHSAGTIYIITQSDPALTKNIIEFTGNHPNAPFEVTLCGVNMGETPTNHNQAPGNSGSATPSGGYINIPAQNTAVKNVTLYLQGENALRNITYYNGGDTNTPSNVKSSLKITDINGDGAVNGGSLYIPKKLEASEIDAFVATKTNYNHWNAGIGGTDGSSLVQNLHIAGGKIQVVTTLGDNCTAIGAGGNGYCQMTISGGEVIAHCNGTGAAIGGGIGWNAAAGKADVTISGGTVYAKNHAKITAAKDGVNHTVGGVAIGSGSTFHSTGSDGTVVITGGTVVAYGAYGNGIGGGNSSTYAGGGAEIIISGGNVTANSIGGGNSAKGVGGSATIRIENQANVTLTKAGTDCDSCGIGGGNSLSGNGGAATITVNGGTIHSDGGIGGGQGGGNGEGGKADVTVNNGTLTAQSIGGGQGSGSGNGGAAIIKIHGGRIETGSIGGGQGGSNGGQLGHATADITNGDIIGQFLLKGAAQSCYFKMSGGTLHGVNAANEKYTMKDGAAVYMDDENGLVEITGGTIRDCFAANGGAVYMTAGSFTMSGMATIANCSAAENGGAVYLGGGTMTISGGDIGTAEAPNEAQNGAGVYMAGGTLNVTGGTIAYNQAAENGGGAYMGGGTLTISGGSIGYNTAQQNGGGTYLGGGTLIVSGGSISHNNAQNSGGGAFVNGGNVQVYGTDTTIFENSAAINGGGIAVNNGNFRMEGGSVDHNKAVGGNGGGIYVSSTSATTVMVEVLSGSVSNNLAGNSGGALAVKGEAGNPILVTVGINEDHFAAEGNPEHGTHGACTCPVINSNTSASSGGAVYVTGSKEAKLCIYCMTETGNVSGDAAKPSDFMMVEGGTVEITTEEPGTEEEVQDGRHGHTVIFNTIYVVGGDVDIWGTMTNPDISNTITVDIKNGAVDDFDDHRITGSSGTEYYKLLYYENFTDPATGYTTGLYKQVRVQKGDTVTIDGFIYRHTGYEIGGWNTHPQNEHPLFATHNPDELGEGESFINEGWYNCKEDYLFDGTNRNHLTLYAIWRPIGYAVVFDPNAGENGQYTGKMEDMALKYDEEMPLTKNAFGRPGYYFKEWNTNADGSGQSYADEALVKNLSNEVGKPVTLYAQWTSCDHDPATHTYTYTTSGNVLTGECDCKGCKVTATLLASDATYDQQMHEASLEITISTSVSEAVEEKLSNITVVHEMYTLPDGENPEANWTQMADGKYPINAGKYRASITVSGQTAVKEYTIQKAPQSAPGKPTYMTNKDDASITTDKLQVNEVQQSALVSTDTTNAETGKIGYDCHVEYAVVYDQGDGTQSEPEWQTARDFTLNTALTNYYVLVRYSEGTNYEASAPARADSKYFFAGDVSIIVHGVDGVDYRLVEATMDNDVVTGVKLTLTVKEGYYFPNNYAVSQITVKPETNGPLTAVPRPDEGNSTKQVYTVNGIQKNSNIDVYLSPVKKLPTIRSFVTEGQVFADFTDTQAVISRDSAYTARFVVENFDASVYTGGIVINGLPDGTPLILMKKCSGTTTYYRANAAGNVALTDFAEMGKENTCFSWNQNEQNVTLQLVAVNSSVLSGSSVSTSLALTHSSEQPNAADVSGTVATELKDEAAFAILEGDASLTLRYTPSEGTASIWNERDNALVLKAAAGTTLPEDAKLKYSYGSYNRDCSMNPEGLFVIPLGQLQSDSITLDFSLSTKMKTGTYSLDAQWYIAQSQAETAPTNGICKGTADITLSAEKANVSLQIIEQEHLYNTGDTLSVQIKVKGIEGFTTKLDLQQKVDGVYQSVDVAKTIMGDCTQTYNLNYAPGSYRLYLYAYTSYSREETSFYFIIQ